MRIIFLIAMAILGASVAMAAPPDFTVAISTAPTLHAGQDVDRGTVINLPAGTEVTLIDRTNKTVIQRICVGAYQGPIEACTGVAECSMLDRARAKCPGTAEGGAVEPGASRTMPIDNP